MGNHSDRIDKLLESLVRASTDLSTHLQSQGISKQEHAQIRHIVETINADLMAKLCLTREADRIMQIPIFTSNEIVSTISWQVSNAEALRSVMTDAIIPLHWSTIYRRVYVLVGANITASESLPQVGHPGLTRWQYRLSWEMQQLRIEGVVKSAGDGYWVCNDPIAQRHQPTLFTDE